MKNKSNFVHWIGIMLICLGIICVLFALIYQMILSGAVYGIIFTGRIIIAHWSAWFFLGLIPMGIGYFIAYVL